MGQQIMAEKTKIGIIICDRYRLCAGGKCLSSLKNREGAFSCYGEEELVELVGYATCGGCPGGNIEYAPEEMIKNGAQTIHFATGMIVGYPPCPHIQHFHDFIESKYGVKVVFGTHPVPQKYYLTHLELGSWESEQWDGILRLVVCDEKTRLAYD